MADALKLKVKGDKKIKKQLKRLRKRGVSAAVKGGLNKGGKVFEQGLKKDIPKQVDGIDKTTLRRVRVAVKSGKIKAKPRGARAVVRGKWIGIPANVMINIKKDEQLDRIHDAEELPAVFIAKQIEFGSDTTNATPWFRPSFEKNKAGALQAFNAEARRIILIEAKKQAAS